jgi:hypothetical protein
VPNEKTQVVGVFQAYQFKWMSMALNGWGGK